MENIHNKETTVEEATPQIIIHSYFTFSNDDPVPEAEAIVTLKGTFVLNLFYSNC